MQSHDGQLLQIEKTAQNLQKLDSEQKQEGGGRQNLNLRCSRKKWIF